MVGSAERQRRYCTINFTRLPNIFKKRVRPKLILYLIRNNIVYVSMLYSQLSLRRTPLGPVLSVRLIKSQIKGIKKGRDQL